MASVDRAEIQDGPEDHFQPMKTRRSGRWSLAVITISVVVVFLILFPKGGVKAGNLPLTWSYLLLAPAAFLALTSSFLTRRHVTSSNWIAGLAFALPFGLYACGSIFLLGPKGVGPIVTMATNTIVFPILFFFCMGAWLDRTKDMRFFLNMVRWCILGAALYGLLLFFLYALTGKTIEIPYLTVNAADENPLLSKNNRRGGLLKLMSSYNNGNIYSVCTLMLLPLYCILEKRSWLQNLVKLAIFLSLSRTAWVGLIFSEMVCLVVLQRKNFKKIFVTLTVLVFFAFCMGILLNLMNRGGDWLMDETMGGRDEQFKQLEEVTVFSNPSDAGVKELVYVSMLTKYGIFGLLLFGLMALGTSAAGFMSGDMENRLRQALMIGCLNYMVVCFSDGAFTFIPVMAFFWILATLLWCRNTAFKEYR